REKISGSFRSPKSGSASSGPRRRTWRSVHCSAHLVPSWSRYPMRHQPHPPISMSFHRRA
ncbi:hypothetical protein PMAYCL1PPCAC_05916, partial [Pristionchus mayeri]